MLSKNEGKRLRPAINGFIEQGRVFFKKNMSSYLDPSSKSLQVMPTYSSRLALSWNNVTHPEFVNKMEMTGYLAPDTKFYI